MHRVFKVTIFKQVVIREVDKPRQLVSPTLLVLMINNTGGMSEDRCCCRNIINHAIKNLAKMLPGIE